MNGKKNISQTSLSKSFCVALCVLHQLLIQPYYGLIEILDYVKQSLIEWVSMINYKLGIEQPEWVI